MENSDKLFLLKLNYLYGERVVIMEEFRSKGIKINNIRNILNSRGDDR